MRGIVIALLLGAVAGAAAVDAALRERPADPGLLTADGTTTAAPRARQRRARANDAGTFAAQVQLHTHVLAASASDLVREFAATAEQPPTRARDERLATALAALAEQDVNAALEVLTRHTFGRRTAHALGLAFLAGAGITPDNAQAVMAVLPRVDRVIFAAEAAVALAVASPERALAFARALPAKLERMRAVAAVAEVVAERDPYVAMRMAEAIPLEPGVLFRPDRRVFQMMALRHLARASFVTAAEYVAREIRAAPSLAMRMDFMEVLRAEADNADPLAALEAARLLDGDLAQEIESAAINRLARDNPLDALAYIDNLPGFSQRAGLRQEVARIYGQRDPEAALAWVQSGDEATARLMVNVLEGVARTDPLRALDIVLEADLSNDGIGVSNGFGTMRMGRDRFDVVQRALDPRTELPPGLAREDLIAQIGERLLALPESQSRQRWIDQYVRIVAADDPAAALTFANENPGTVQRWLYSNLVQIFRGDPLAAMDYIDLVPAEMRSVWTHSVASRLAERDAPAALEWIESYRGQAEFPSLATAVAGSLARSNPAAALDLVATLPLAQQVDATRGIAGAWADTDAVAARAWVESLPPGPNRDAAVPGLLMPDWGRLMNGSSMPALDPTLLALFSSDAARQEAVVQIANMVGQRRPAAAQALIDAHVTDPVLRVRAEAWLAERARWQ